ncbi:uncharacterized protein LOC116306396 [Actinia tenebrosa]|uniref:Uncharacterized protein LOC116306396 n=1 Tax=Actinia tenebrosa TaxID=6105 RepID=A0A6P8J2L4_ACTTE|nr:uncharacterized protein LOC116306396 [Actinia tenebrosa]
MADEEELESCSYLSFAERYQADLELIYQKYEQIEDGCVESQEILLSDLGNRGNVEYDWLEDLLNDESDQKQIGAADDSDGVCDESDDEGCESDSSGHTTSGELSSHNKAPHQNLAKAKLHKDVQNCEINDKSKPMQFVQPLSSTLVSDSTGISEIKMDPILSPVELQLNNDFKESAGLKNEMLDQGPGYPFTPGIMNENILTSTKLESSPNLPTIRHKVPPAITSHETEEHVTPDIINENPSSEGLSSFAQAVLNSRNKIANVLFKAVMNFQKGNSSKDSDYDSLSTDTTSSSSTVQSNSKESLFLPDKLLKEFSNRLTAEIMSNGNNSSCLNEPNHSLGDSSSLTRRNQSLQKTKMVIGPNAIASNKNRTVSLLTGRRTIRFNPSLPGLRKQMSSTPQSDDKKSVYIPLSMNTKTVDQHGRLKSSLSTKAVFKISPVQSTLPTTLAPKNAICFKQSASEQTTARNSPLKLLQRQQTPVVSKLPQVQNQRPSMNQGDRLQLVKKSDNFSKPVIKLQESGRPCVAISRRRSVPLTNCLPVTHSEILRHSTNLSDFQRYMQHHGKIPEALPRSSLPGQDRRGNSQSTPMARDREEYYDHRKWGTLKVHPEFHKNLNNHLPGQDGTKVSRLVPGQNLLGSSRKRSFDSALFCANEKTSPKRTCLRTNDDKKSSVEKDLFALKLGAGKEIIVGSAIHNERQKKHQEIVNIPEMFDDIEVRNGNREFGNSSWKEDKSQESNCMRDFVETRPRKHSQKLFTDGTRSPYSLVKPVNPCDNMKKPLKRSNDGYTKDACRESFLKDTATLDGGYQKSHGSLVRTGEGVDSPSYRDRGKQQLIRGNTLEEFKKLSPGSRIRKDTDSTARTAYFSSEKMRRSSCSRTSQEDRICYKDYRSRYESATEESCSRRRHTTTRNPSPERQFFSDRDSRTSLEMEDQNYRNSNRKKYSIHRERHSPCSTSHEKLTSRMNLAKVTVEKTPNGEIPFPRRKRDQESKDNNQGVGGEICLNETFKIDKTSRVSKSYDSCTSSRCTKFFCLNCGNFPSIIQDSSISSAGSFIGD